jgi:3-hydroxybutyryl-CoA dehydrogenase
LKGCDIVIEAIIEQLPAKRELWGALDKICPKATIFASNTSSLSITEMATFTQRPDRFLGLHFFNPVPVMKLVEVIRTIATDPKVNEEVVAFAGRLGKTPVRTSDRTGFIVNRLLVPYLLDAVRALEEGVGSVEDIDNSMKLGCGHPMGPLTLLDFVGNDTTYYIANIMFDEFKEKRFASPPLLKRMVLSGWNGRKAGRGFYDYSDPAKPKPMQLT